MRNSRTPLELSEMESYGFLGMLGNGTRREKLHKDVQARLNYAQVFKVTSFREQLVGFESRNCY